MTSKKSLVQRIGSAWKKSQTLAVRLDQDADARLELICQRWQCSRGEVIRRLIRQVS